MFKLRRIKLDKIKDFFKKLPKTLGRHYFSVFLILILGALIWGAFLYYKYNFLAERMKPEILEEPLSFDEKIFQEVLKIWQEREEKFKEAEFKKYPDPFQVQVIETID